MAEAYLRSKQLPGVEVRSSGTVAEKYRATNDGNFARTLRFLKTHGLESFAKDHYGDQLDAARLVNNDVVVFVNQIARDEYDDADHLLPANTFVWDIADVGERPGITITTEDEIHTYSEEVFRQLSNNIDDLVRNVLASARQG